VAVGPDLETIRAHQWQPVGAHEESVFCVTSRRHDIEVCELCVAIAWVAHDEGIVLGTIEEAAEQVGHRRQGRTVVVRTAEAVVDRDACGSGPPSKAFTESSDEKCLRRCDASPNHLKRALSAASHPNRLSTLAAQALRQRHDEITNARKLMHVMVSIDVHRWASEPGRERISLTFDLALDLVDGKRAPHGGRIEGGHAWKLAGGSQSRHGRDRSLIGEREMETDVGLRGDRFEGVGLLRPMGRSGHDAGCGDAAGGQQLTNGAADAGGEAVVVGAHDEALRLQLRCDRHVGQRLRATAVPELDAMVRPLVQGVCVRRSNTAPLVQQLRISIMLRGTKYDRSRRRM
jgi:hypothetical protein